MLQEQTVSAYISILHEELLLATGCTEPIALAYCAAKVRQVLGALPERLKIEVSGNIMKNVKSVIVPNTGGRKGIKAAVAAGIVAGDADKVLQVISAVPADQHAAIAGYETATPMEIVCPETAHLLDIRITAWAGADCAAVRIANNHSNIVYMEKNGTVLLEKADSDSPEDSLTDKSVLNVAISWNSPTRWTCPGSASCWTGRSTTTAPLPRRASRAAGGPTSAASCFTAIPMTSRPRQRPGPPPGPTPA